MEGVERVDQLSATRTHWVAEVAGVRREWDAETTRQEPDRLIEWAGFGGADNVGVIEFEPVTPDCTTVRVGLEWSPEGALENVAGALGIVSRRVSDDLVRFKRFVEDLGEETGGWRGEIAPDVPAGEVRT